MNKKGFENMRGFLRFLGADFSMRISTLSNKFNTGKKNAFTLAEVLITLGIIGVVAALTLPTLITNYKKQALVTQLKKSINIVENLANRIVADEGVSEFGQTEFVSKYLSCYEGVIPCSDTNEILKKYLNVVDAEAGSTEITKPTYKKMSGDNYDVYALQKLVLADGTIIYSSYWQGANQITTDGFWNMTIDINGEKGPNTLGQDLYRGRLSANGRFADFSVYESSRLNDCSNLNTLVEKECYIKKIQSDGWKMNY